MKKNLLIISLLLAIIFVLVACSNSAETTPSASNVQTGSSSAQASSSAAETDKAAISIENFAFSPDTLTIKAGTTVVWTNNDSASHDIKSSDFSSPMLAKGETYEFKYDKAGTYDYTCGVHPSMKGQIVVE